MFYEPKKGHPFKIDPFKALVFPRPIGWISSISNNGVANLAPYSYFNAIADIPPQVMFCSNGNTVHGKYKDSLTNIFWHIHYGSPCIGSLQTWNSSKYLHKPNLNLPKFYTKQRDSQQHKICFYNFAIQNKDSRLDSSLFIITFATKKTIYYTK